MIKYMIKKLYHSKIYNFLVWPQAHFSGVRTRHFLPVLHSLSLTKKGIYWNTNKYVTKHGTWLKEYCVHLEYSGLLAQALLFVLFCDSATSLSLVCQPPCVNVFQLSPPYLFSIQVRSGGARCELHWIHNSALLTMLRKWMNWNSRKTLSVTAFRMFSS